MSKGFAFFFITLVCWVASAQEVREFYIGARGLGMGGTQGIAVVNDETSLLVNPAGLGKLRDWYGTILDPEVEVGSRFYDTYRKKALTPFDLDSVKNALNVDRDTHYHAKAMVFPSFVVRNFGIGIYGRYVLDAKMDTAGTQLTTFYQDDLALVMGFNFRLFDGRLKIGANGRLISRIEVDGVLNPAQTLDLSTVGSEGAGVATDVGMILTAPWAWLPTISAVVRDLNGTKFTMGSGLRKNTATRPAEVEQDVDVAIALFPIHGNHTRSSFTVEYQKIKAAAADSNKTKYTHLGYELNVYDLLFLRAGMNGRYWTTGLELSSEHTQVQLAYYGEEIGTAQSPEEEKRLVFKFAFRF